MIATIHTMSTESNSTHLMLSLCDYKIFLAWAQVEREWERMEGMKEREITLHLKIFL